MLSHSNTHHFYKYFYLILIYLASCSSPPPVKQAPTVKKWQDLINKGEITRVTQTTLNYELWTDKTVLPSIEALEDNFAASTIDVELAKKNEKLVIDFGDTGQCSMEMKKNSNDLRAERSVHCMSSLNAQESKVLANATSTLVLHCQSNDINSHINGHHTAVALNKLMQGVWVRIDVDCGAIQRLNHFKVQDFISLQSHMQGETMTIWTQGMNQFGLPEIILSHISSDRQSESEEALYSIADGAIRIEGVSAGSTIQRGSVMATLVPSSQFRTIHVLPKLSPSNAFVIVDPSADSTDTKALQVLARKLTL